MQRIDDDHSSIDEIGILCDSINRVDCVGGCTMAAPDTWRIHIDDVDTTRVIEVSTDALIKPTKFKQQYLKQFGKPAPPALHKKWDAFVASLGAIRQVVTEEDNPIKYAVDGLIEKLSDFELTTDGSACSIGNTILYEHAGFVLCRSAVVMELLKDITRVDSAEIGKYCKLKNITYEPPTGRVVKMAGKSKRCWWFRREAFSEYWQDGEE